MPLAEHSYVAGLEAREQFPQRSGDARRGEILCRFLTQDAVEQLVDLLELRHHVRLAGVAHAVGCDAQRPDHLRLHALAATIKSLVVALDRDADRVVLHLDRAGLERDRIRADELGKPLAAGPLP